MSQALHQRPALPHVEVECHINAFVEEWRDPSGSRYIEFPIDVSARASIPSGLVAGSWLRSALAELSRLTALEDNWDGYGAPVIHPMAIIHALRFLEDTATRGNAAPAIVATGAGAVQLEWHRDGFEIDVEILPDGTFEASMESPDGTEDYWSEDLRNGVPPDLAQYIFRLSIARGIVA